MFYVVTPSGLPPGGGAGGSLMGRILAWMTWALFAMMGLMFLFVLLFWLAVMAVFSLVAGLVTGRPSTVGMLWRQYRDLARQRWPRPPSSAASATPRADAATGATPPSDERVQDVTWRDVSESEDNR